MARQRKKMVLRAADGVNHELSFTKVDRSDLYGTTESEYFDAAQRQVREAELLSDGETVIAKKTRLVTDGDATVSRGEIRYRGDDGNLLTEVTSMFNQDVPIAEVDPEQAMKLSCKGTYRVELDPDVSADLIALLGAGKIFEFQFAWNATVNPSIGLLLANEAGQPFFMVGTYSSPEMLDVQRAEEPDFDAEEMEDDEEDDGLDFGSL